MRVLFLGHRPDRPDTALIAGVARSGVDTAAVCDPQWSGTDALHDAGVVLHPLDLHDVRAATARALRALGATDVPDVLHVFTSRALRCLRPACDAFPAARVVYYRGKVERPRWWHPNDRRKYLSHQSAAASAGENAGPRPFIDRFSAVSRAVADALIDGGVDRGRIRVIHKGHDPTWYRVAPVDLRKELGLSPERFLVAVVANMRHEKGIEEILDAASLLEQRGHRAVWVLIGRDGRRPWQRRRRPLARPGVIFSLGWRGDVPALIRGTDCLVNASHTEGLPKAVIEAMLCETPVAATRVGGVPELIEHERTGLLVPPHNPHALAAAVERLAEDHSLCRSLAEAAFTWAVRELTVERTVRQTLALYEDLLSSAP